ncbi:MAG: hypothetical protein ACK5LO_08965 [Leucobacter sp.]
MPGEEHAPIDDITTGEQATAVVAATFFSLAFGLITQLFVLDVQRLNWWPLIWQSIAIIVVLGFGFGWPNLRRVLARHVELIPAATPAIWVDRLQRSALFISSLQCIVLLGYFATYTGGTLHSPYAQSLLAMALLSPQIARTKDVVLMTFIAVFIVFAVFGDWTGTASSAAQEIPSWLYFLTPFVAAVIALTTPLFGKPRQSPLVWMKDARSRSIQ